MQQKLNIITPIFVIMGNNFKKQFSLLEKLV